MVAIVSHEIVLVVNKPNNYIKHLVLFADDLGAKHRWSYNHPAAEDVLSVIEDEKLRLPDKIIKGEKESVKERIRSGASPADIVTIYLTNDQKVKAIIRAFMSTGDPALVMPTAEFIDANISNAQLQSHFTTAQSIRIRTRVDLLIANKQFLVDDATAVEDL